MRVVKYHDIFLIFGETFNYFVYNSYFLRFRNQYVRSTTKTVLRK